MESLTKWQQAETVWLINKKPEGGRVYEKVQRVFVEVESAPSRPHAALAPRQDNPGPCLQSSRRGTREAQPCFAFSQRTREIHVVPRLMRRLGCTRYHNGEGSAL